MQIFNFQPNYQSQYKQSFTQPQYEILLSKIRANDPDATLDEIIAELFDDI